MTIATQHALSKDQVRLYHKQGWLGPFTLVSEEEMAAAREAIDAEILGPGRAQGLAERDYFHNRHLDNRWSTSCSAIRTWWNGRPASSARTW